ncbi:hypothetical protein CCHR01_08586 [Colletotrichum chrysophilum]|uniref:Uncharacterized protein n=1 Tax=Colletotrichum chrysophilum TaxID=1836956 RepID=A0AAD9ELC0_9PEZI|nr:hypothetical protein CCHR01_08586 [Colletotrichum chrysophilum]
MAQPSIEFNHECHCFQCCLPVRISPAGLLHRPRRENKSLLSLCLCAASSPAPGKLVTASSVSRSVVSSLNSDAMPCHAMLSSRFPPVLTLAAPAPPRLLLCHMSRGLVRFSGTRLYSSPSATNPWPIPKLDGRFVRFST